MNNNFAACVQSVRHQHAYMISDCRATGQSSLHNVLFKVNPSLRQAFLGHRCHKSLFRTRIVA